MTIFGSIAVILGIPVELVVQCFKTDTEHFGGAGFVIALHFQGAQDELPFHLFDCGTEVHRYHVGGQAFRFAIRDGANLTQTRGQIRWLNVIAAR